MRKLVFALVTFSLYACDCGDGSGLRTVQPDITAEPSPLVFDSAYVGFVARETLTIRNAGDANLTVTSIELAEGSAPGLSVDDIGFSLGATETRAIEVRFDVTSEGRAEGTLLIASNDPDTASLEVPIVAEGTRRPGPVLAVCVESAAQAKACADPLRIDFGPTPYGTTKEATISIESAGTLPVTIISAAADPASHPSITFEPATLLQTLAPSESRAVTVRFTPAVPEEVSAIFEIESDDGERSFVPVIITGSGIAPALCPSAAAIDFGTVAIGTFADRTLTIENCGQVDFELRALEIESDPEFTVLNAPAQPMMVAPAATFDVQLRYQPTDAGRDQDRLRIRSSLPDGYIAMTGQSASCDLLVTPTSINFGGTPTTGTQRALVVANNGTAECTLNAVSIASGTTSEFSIAAAPSLPTTIASGASVTIQIGYRPTDLGADTGIALVDTNDPLEPRVMVQLSGRRLGAGECMLSVQPDPLAFGAVPIGTSQAMNVQVTNTGGSLCTVVAANLSAASSRAFQVTPPAFPWLIPNGQSRTIEIRFTPVSAALETANLEIFSGLIAVNPTFIVPISGSGSGAQLCPDPDPLVFGTHAVGLVTTRTLTLHSCGTQPVIISQFELPAPTSPEYSLAMTPMLPLTIPAATSVTLDVRHQGTNNGRDDGILRIHSNDSLRATRDVGLVAASSPDACGDLQGRICDLTGGGPAAGVTVYVDTPGGRISTTTNQDGDWVLTCLINGSQTVHAEAGSWSTTFTGNVTPGTVETIPGQQCLQTDSAEIAVVAGQWDQMENILGFMGIPYTLYGDFGGPSVDDLVEDPQTMAQYDIIFFNCGWDEFDALTGPGLTNIRNFVENGGSIYASDWAYEVVELGWPGYVDYYRNDTVIDDAQAAPDFNGLGTIIHAPLIMALGGRTQIPLTAVSNAAAIESIMGATSYIEGTRFNDGVNHPMMVSFQPTMNSGQVLYTDFHNNGQQDVIDLFRWLILQL